MSESESDNAVYIGKNLTVNKIEKNQGYFGYRGIWEDTKEVTVVRLKKEDFRDDWESIVGEKHQSKLDALHVLKIVGCEEDSDWRYFAFEPYESTLYEYVNSPEEYTGLSLPPDLVVLYQIVSAVHFLHGIKIVHGDLNPLTICIESDNSKGLIVSARIKVRESLSNKNEKQTEESHLICNSKYWRRPERIDSPPEYEDDIFSVGCLCYYFITGQHPFAELSSTNGEKILKNIRNKKPTHFLNAERKIKEHFAYQYIKKMIMPENDTYNWLRDFHHTKIDFENALPLKFNSNEQLGKGAYGDVFKGTYEGENVAVKVIKKLTPEQQREFVEHQRLNHKNVVKLLHVQDSDDKRFTYLVLKLCIATLADYFPKKKEELPDLPKNQVHLLYQLVVGLHYIHICGLVHRDLKPDNILVFKKDNSMCLKISDFGLCKRTDEDGNFSQHIETVKKGDSIALAPERIKVKEEAMKKNKTVGNKLPDGTIFSDIFELAIVLYYIFTGGQHPFQNEGEHKKIKSNILKNNPVHLNKELEKSNNDNLEYKIFSLIKGMLAFKPEDRTPLPKVIEELKKMLCYNCIFKKFWGFDKCYTADFHPRQRVLALGTYFGKVFFYSAENNSIPFSNWKKDELFYQVDEKILKVKWNLDGTLLAGVCERKHDERFKVIVWSYQHNGAGSSLTSCFILSHEIIPEISFKKIFLKKEFAIEWNPYSPNMFAVFQIIPSSLLECHSFPERFKDKFYLFNSTSMDHSEIKIGESISKRKLIWISEKYFIFTFIQDKYGRIKSVEIFEILNGTSKRAKILDDVVDCVWDKRTQCLAICYERNIEILSLGPNGRLEPLHQWTNLDGEKNFTAMAWCPNFNHPNDENSIETARKSPDNFIFACATYYSKNENRQIVIWTPLKEQTIKNTHDLGFNLVSSLSFSPDGQFLVAEGIGIGGYSRMIVVLTKNWDVQYIPEIAGTPLSWIHLSMDMGKCKFFNCENNQVGFMEYAVVSDEEIKEEKRKIEGITLAELSGNFKPMRLPVMPDNLAEFFSAKPTWPDLCKLGTSERTGQKKHPSFSEVLKYINGVMEDGVNVNGGRCASCLKTSESLKVCARCHLIFYCSKECQRSDWPWHKIPCRQGICHSATAIL